MLDLKIFYSETDRIVAGLKKRCIDNPEALIEEIVALDQRRKSLKTDLDAAFAKRNSSSKEIGNLFKSGKADEANALKAEVQKINVHAAEIESKLKNIKESLDEALVQIPNIPHESVPAGNTEDDNEVFQDWEGELPTLDDDALPHWELAKKYNLIDFELGAKISGAGFPLFRGKGSALNRALINFFLTEAIRAGYEEVSPPHLVNEASAYATTQLPDKEGQMYYAEKDDLYLIPTAEVPITNIFRDEIVKEEDLPHLLTGYTPCFRREAGSYGSHVKGLNRVHQFDKVEIVRIEHPDRSYDALMGMVEHVKGILKDLNLPYRILRLCGGDLGFASALTFDFEVYSAAQKRWLEVSSVSNFETFQSNRLKCRFKNSNGKNQMVHTLNGSALALARIVAAILENNQTSEGILIPRVLVNFTGFDRIK